MTRANLALALAAATLVLGLAACGGGGSSNESASTTETTTPGPSVLAALVSDIGKFNDRGFNQNQLAGLKRAKSELGAETLPLQSNSVSDYIPNLTTAVRRDADIVISAGFLLADATATMAKKFPGTHFAITDYSVDTAPFADKEGTAALRERARTDLRLQRGWMSRRRARREERRSGWARRRSVPSAA